MPLIIFSKPFYLTIYLILRRDLSENGAVRVTGWGKVTNLKISESNPDRTLRDKELKVANKRCPQIQTNIQLCAGTKEMKSKYIGLFVTL